MRDERYRILPKDWDMPGRGNEALCALFSPGAYKTDQLTLAYRLFASEGTAAVPLVLYLHGADAIGGDNASQLTMHDVGTMFAKPAWQKKHPCFILAPQCGTGQHWSMPDVREAVRAMLLSLAEREKRIDAGRLYIYGYSAGGVGTLELLKAYPGLFAAAVSICGAVGGWRAEALTRTPLWMVHAADDRIVKADYGGTDSTAGYLGSRNVSERFGKTSGWDFHYTEYPAGYMAEHYGVNPHCSWVAVSDPANREIGEWLFSHGGGAADPSANGGNARFDR